ncbi:hypothetical protein Bca52824_045969 [Brassica carinata]|uniref:Uncharacterized protein n=1 Tax=Brassica carinata TaxID=52824 RepID=A0A8X7UNL6_BRACI|nr:hypothetical protein Bca52824_045969 [Brassica carinata]
MAKQLQQSVTDTTRSPLVPAEKNNAVAATRRSRTMEVSSRYRSPTPTKTRRCPSPNVTRTVSSTSVSRKHTPERKRSPLKGKNVTAGQSENSKPVDDGPHSRLIEQHRWPSRMSMNRSLDLGNKAVRTTSLSLSNKSSKPLQNLLATRRGLMSPTNSENGSNSLNRLLSASSLDRATSARVHPLSAPGSRAASPSRSSFSSSSSSSSSSHSRGMSPLRGANLSCVRSSTPPPRGVSPSRLRQTNASTSSPTSVLSFMADVKKGKKASYIEDVHQLRLLYNRFSQWRFANARAEGVGYIQRLIAEETLYNVWHATSELRDHVTTQRIYLQQLKLEIKLEDILSKQMGCLEDWAILEREHVTSVAGAIADLEANTLRLPLTGGTKVDLGTLKLAMSSALDVMQTMGSSICSLHSQMEEMNKLVSDLAVIAAKEKYMLGKCENLLASTAVMEIEESSLMTHLMQKKQEEVRDDAESPLLPLGSFKCLWT